MRNGMIYWLLPCVTFAIAALSLQGSAQPDAGKKVDLDLQKLLVARHQAAMDELKTQAEAYNHGTATLDMLLTAYRRVYISGLELAPDQPAKVALAEEFVKRTKDTEARIAALFEAGRAGGEANRLYQARYERLDAEIQLARLKAK